MTERKMLDGWLQIFFIGETLYGKITAHGVRPSIYKIKKSDDSILSDKLI